MTEVGDCTMRSCAQNFGSRPRADAPMRRGGKGGKGWQGGVTGGEGGAENHGGHQRNHA